MRRLVILLLGVIFFSNCEKLNPLQDLAGPELFPYNPKGQRKWSYIYYIARYDEAGRINKIAYGPIKENFEYDLDKYIKIDFIYVTTTWVGSSGSSTTRYNINSYGVFWDTGYELLLMLPFPAIDGRKWKVEQVSLEDSQGFPFDCYVEGEIHKDKVSVPAGDFDTYRVDLYFYDSIEKALGRKKLKFIWVRWYAKDVGMVQEYDGYCDRYAFLESY